MKKFVLIFLAFYWTTNFSQAKEIKNVSLDELMNETQYSSDNSQMIEFIWWLPREFWETSNAQDPTSSPEDFEALNQIFGEFELFGIVRGDIGHFGGISYHSKEEILKNFVVNYKGEDLKIVPDTEISPDFSNFLMIMQPMLGNMLGEMGNNIHFILLKSIRGNEVLPIDPLQKNILNIKLDNFEKKIELPLSSLLLEKKCSEDEVLYSGKWIYCPIHGKKLIAQ